MVLRDIGWRSVRTASDHLILIFGEDDNDRRALVHLVRALTPTGSSVGIETRRRPIILSREAVRRPAVSEEIAALWRVEQKPGRRVVVLAHRDCDDLEPAHVAEAEALKREIRAAGVTEAVAATPAWEIEIMVDAVPGGACTSPAVLASCGLFKSACWADPKCQGAASARPSSS